MKASKVVLTMNKTQRITLYDLLDEVEEPRRGNAIKHNLKDIIFIGLLSTICNADDFTGMQIFGETHKELFEQFLELPHGIPSHDTFDDVFSAIDPQQLASCFEQWLSLLYSDLKDARLVAVDGKTIRRSKSQTKKATHVVTAFSSDLKLVLGQLSTDEKSNEITAIPRLLNMFGLKGKTITIDAMGTQTEIAKTIINGGGDYLLTLKENQPNLLNDIRLYLNTEIISQKKDSLKEAGLYSSTKEKCHGRIENRECYLCDTIDWLEQKEAWAGLTGAGVIISKREINGQISEQSHYFIYSHKEITAQEIMEIKRSHWNIENSLHWILDITFREDENRARTGNAAINLNILRKQALQLMKRDTTVKGSMKSKRLRCGWDISFALQLLGISIS